MTEMKLQPPTNDGRDPINPPRMPYLKMGSTSDGRSTIAQQILAGFLQKSVSGDTPAIWMREFPGTVKAVWFNILPVGWVGEWHPSPALQWVVPLSGRWFIETQLGERIEMGPGEIHWGADVEGDTDASRMGHRSGQVGDLPCVQLMVQFFETTDQDVGASVTLRPTPRGV
jgi:hypothetical protein